MAKRQEIKSRVRLALALLIGAVFAYAGVMKARDPARFAMDIANFDLLTWRGAVLLALYLPPLEILCGMALLSGKLRRGALAIAFVLTLSFLTALISAKARDLNIACGCFGSARQSDLSYEIAGDAVLLLCVSSCIALERKAR